MKKVVMMKESMTQINKMTIDLHGFNVEEATATLINALFSFRLDKYDNKLEIITGNGQGII